MCYVGGKKVARREGLKTDIIPSEAGKWDCVGGKIDVRGHERENLCAQEKKLKKRGKEGAT